MTTKPSTFNWLRFVAGILASCALGFVVCLVYAWLYRATLPPNARKLNALLEATVYPNFFLVPALMGTLAAFIWRTLALPIWVHLLGSLAITLLAGAGAFLVFGEGAVCLIMGLPLILAIVIGGDLMGRVLFRHVPPRLHASIVPLLVLAVFAEGRVPAQRSGMVVDEIVIAAPPAAVWRNVVAFPPIPRPATWWLNRIGLPSASATTSEGEFVGARRECIFSNGLVFKEVVAEIERERLLTFDIVEQPADPELLGHIVFHRGQFELVANPDGTTTLIGRSWFTLHVRPLWYFDWWNRAITREVHLRVMRHIKELSENAAAPPAPTVND